MIGDVGQPPVSVVEMPEFIATTRRLMSEEDRSVLIDHLARHPTDGVVIPGTGGVRKLRWRLAGRGKRGGARVVYFFHNRGMPLFALTAFAKNEKGDLSQADKNDFRRLTQVLVATYGGDADE
jgi:hypothetical protein